MIIYCHPHHDCTHTHTPQERELQQQHEQGHFMWYQINLAWLSTGGLQSSAIWISGIINGEMFALSSAG